jgi:bacteriocin-like protein
MNIRENKLEELNSSELKEITGGDFWFDLGASAHNAVNALAEMAGSMRDTHNKYGYIK